MNYASYYAADMKTPKDASANPTQPQGTVSNQETESMLPHTHRISPPEEVAQDWGKIITQFGMVTMENTGNETYAHTSGNTSNLAVKVIARKLQCLW